MEIIHIRAGRGYDVCIGGGLLEHCGEHLARLHSPCRLLAVSDSNVAPLYLERTLQSLREAGFQASSFVFSAGEGSKNLSTLSDILEAMAEARLTREDMAVALGGGVTGDMTGFAAGCYMRGIPCVQLPTSLLAAVDSSVGGKTAIDLRAGKNLAGLFVQPAGVLCDTDTLSTLPSERFADGAAEAIKMGILFDESLFRLFEQGNPAAEAEKVIETCVRLKGRVVEQDEQEHGQRKLLNLGHTVGHAVELCSGYTLSHGQAVAVGTAVICRAAHRLGLSEQPCGERVTEVLRRNGLPVHTDFSAGELAKAALLDKKRGGDRITLILPRRIGECFLYPVQVEQLEAIFAAGMEERA